MQIGIIRGEANTDVLAAPDLNIYKWIELYLGYRLC